MKKIVDVKCDRRAESPFGPEKYASVFIVREQVDEFLSLLQRSKKRDHALEVGSDGGEHQRRRVLPAGDKTELGHRGEQC